MIRMSHPAPVLDWWITLERREFWYLADIVALSQIILHKSAPLALMVWAPFLSGEGGKKKIRKGKNQEKKSILYHTSGFPFPPPPLPKNGYYFSMRRFLFYQF